jgi:hypothetical protein
MLKKATTGVLLGFALSPPIAFALGFLLGKTSIAVRTGAASFVRGVYAGRIPDVKRHILRNIKTTDTTRIGIPILKEGGTMWEVYANDPTSLTKENVYNLISSICLSLENPVSLLTIKHKELYIDSAPCFLCSAGDIVKVKHISVSQQTISNPSETSHTIEIPGK